MAYQVKSAITYSVCAGVDSMIGFSEVSLVAQFRHPVLQEEALLLYSRDVSTGVTGATVVAAKFSDILTLSSPGGTDSVHHCSGRN